MPKFNRAGNTDTRFWISGGNLVELHCGDVINVLKRLPVRSVQTVVTSPPYWALRDYGTGKWSGGNIKCSHKAPDKWIARFFASSSLPIRKDGSYNSTQLAACHGQWLRQNRNKCPRCGAIRVDNQLGSEATPDEFVAKLVEVFNWVKRVLRKDGTVWLNLGDTYSGPKGDNRGSLTGRSGKELGFDELGRGSAVSGLNNGNLVGIPWRVALALQQSGWILRQDIIWSKPSPMPESVRNRCTKAHEYLFLLTKSENYYYNADAIRENQNELRRRGKSFRDGGAFTNNRSFDNSGNTEKDTHGDGSMNYGRNKRSVWTVASESYKGAHFATFPRKLVEPCILAGTSEYGCCADCGRPYKRVIETTQLKRERPNDYVKRTGAPGTGNVINQTVAGVSNKTVGWEAQCNCAETTGRREVVPCTVLDPFVGSGTTCVVAIAHGRRSVGIDLNADYLTNQAVPRIQGELMSRPALAHLANVKTKSVKLERKIRSK